MKKTVAACLAICAAWGTAFGLGIQANGDRSIAVTNASGTAVVTFTGLLPKFGPKAGGLPFDAVRATAVGGGYEVEYAPRSAFPADWGTARATGRFEPLADGTVKVEYRLSFGGTNCPFSAGMSMIGRRHAKGLARADGKVAPFGYWVRDVGGGQPWEEPLGQIVAWTNATCGIRYLYGRGRGTNPAWQDPWNAHLSFAKDESGDWVGGFTLVDAADPRSDLALVSADAGRRVAISLSTDRTYNWFGGTDGELSYAVRVENCDAAEDMVLDLSSVVRTYDGQVVASATRRIGVRAGAARSFPARFEAGEERGIYFVEASVKDAAGNELAFSRTNLVKLPDVAFSATPETSVFGISAYWPIPDEESVQRLMDRMGVRWVRTGNATAQHPPRTAIYHSNLKTSLTGEAREKWIVAELEKCRSRGNRLWEFGNELNMSTIGIGMEGGGIGRALAAPLYAEWVREVVRIRAERGYEDIRLLSLGVAGFDRAFFNKMNELGIWDLLDGICLHPGRGNFVVEYPYLQPENWRGASKEIEDPAGKKNLSHSNYWNYLGSVRGCLEMIARNGQKPLWLTEVYTPTYPNTWWNDTLRNAADNAFLIYCFMKADGVKCGMFYQLFESVWYDQLGINPKDREYSFGLLNRDLSFKPCLMAYCAAAEFLDRAEFDGWFQCREATTHAMRFKVPEGTAAVLWDRSEGLILNADHGEGGYYRSPEAWESPWKKRVPVTFVADGPVTVTDAIGRTRVVERKGGVVTVPADGSVRVVKGRNLRMYK